MKNCGESLVVIVRAANVILCIHNALGGSKLTLLLRDQQAGLAARVQELRESLGFHEEGREGANSFTIPLPHLRLEATQVLKKVIRGCGAAENADLLFYFVTRAE